MNFAPTIMFGFYVLLGIAFWGFVFWLAYQLVTAIRGIHVEMERIRRLLESSATGRARTRESTPSP
jgi:hypothetical protein